MASRRNHDTESGLCWTETIISAPDRPSAQLSAFFSTPVTGPPARVSKGKGVDSLEEIAIRCLMGCLDRLDEASLEGLPEVWVGRVWRRILACNLQTLHLWQLFSTASPSSPPSPTYTSITRHHIPLSLLLPCISSPSLSFLTTLTLVDKIPSPHSSISLLSTLPNLIALNISGSSASTRRDSMVDDEVIRAWGKQARHAKGFQRLKLLFLRFQMGVSERGFEELSAFGNLEVVVTSRCGILIKEAKRVCKARGWKITNAAFYAHVNNVLTDRHQGKNYLDVVQDFITTYLHPSTRPSEKQPPLSFVQVGRHESALSTNVLHNVNEIGCWVRDEEAEENADEGKRKLRGAEEEKMGVKKKRRIKEVKKKDLLDLLESM